MLITILNKPINDLALERPILGICFIRTDFRFGYPERIAELFN